MIHTLLFVSIPFSLTKYRIYLLICFRFPSMQAHVVALCTNPLHEIFDSNPNLISHRKVWRYGSNIHVLNRYMGVICRQLLGEVMAIRHMGVSSQSIGNVVGIGSDACESAKPTKVDNGDVEFADQMHEIIMSLLHLDVWVDVDGMHLALGSKYLGGNDYGDTCTSVYSTIEYCIWSLISRGMWIGCSSRALIEGYISQIRDGTAVSDDAAADMTGSADTKTHKCFGDAKMKILFRIIFNGLCCSFCSAYKHENDAVSGMSNKSSSKSCIGGDKVPGAACSSWCLQQIRICVDLLLPYIANNNDHNSSMQLCASGQYVEQLLLKYELVGCVAYGAVSVLHSFASKLDVVCTELEYIMCLLHGKSLTVNNSVVTTPTAWTSSGENMSNFSKCFFWVQGCSEYIESINNYSKQILERRNSSVSSTDSLTAGDADSISMMDTLQHTEINWSRIISCYNCIYVLGNELLSILTVNCDSGATAKLDVASKAHTQLYAYLSKNNIILSLLKCASGISKMTFLSLCNLNEVNVKCSDSLKIQDILSSIACIYLMLQCVFETYRLGLYLKDARLIAPDVLFKVEYCVCLYIRICLITCISGAFLLCLLYIIWHNFKKMKLCLYSMFKWLRTTYVMLASFNIKQ